MVHGYRRSCGGRVRRMCDRLQTGGLQEAETLARLLTWMTRKQRLSLAVPRQCEGVPGAVENGDSGMTSSFYRLRHRVQAMMSTSGIRRCLR